MIFIWLSGAMGGFLIAQLKQKRYTKKQNEMSYHQGYLQALDDMLERLKGLENDKQENKKCGL